MKEQLQALIKKWKAQGDSKMRLFEISYGDLARDFYKEATVLDRCAKDLESLLSVN